MTDAPLPVKGIPGSPYTRKMLALLRYRRIPYRYLQGGPDSFPDLPRPKVQLLPVFYFTDHSGELIAEVDSTPIIRRLEGEYSGRSVIPTDPALAFVNSILEDYGDEWLTKAMFHYRWYHNADIEMAGSVLPHYDDVTQSDEVMATAGKIFSERQISRLYVVGSNDATAVVIENSYRRFLTCLNAHLKELPFLLGRRPVAADFGCLGQLTQLTQFDPTPAQIASIEFPRVHAWVSKMEDLSGLEVEDGDFIKPGDPPATLRELLAEVGRTYVPVMLANAHALDQGLDSVETTVEGQSWVQDPFPYQGKCLQWLRNEYSRLEDNDRATVNDLLDGTGCEALVAA